MAHIIGAGLKTVIGAPVIHNLNVNVTNACNQKCPMCNARLDIKDASTMSAADFLKYLQILKPHLPATCTLSGGEPTIAKELPEIINLAKHHFPFGVGLSTNMYGHNDLVRNNLIAALKSNIRISVSLDGLTDEANKQRGVLDAWQKTTENMEFLTKKKKELNSSSPLVVHTVVSNRNIGELNKIVEYSSKLGWNQRIAPIQSYEYKENDENNKLTYSEQLKATLSEVKAYRHVKQSHEFINGILGFVQNRFPKLCPYLTFGMRYLKVFLDPDGSISMCNRETLGNLNDSNFREILKKDSYKKFVKYCHTCRGCWTACFVEPVLYV
ncbi:radical SAM protein, partial [bacterium]|nr:radical SAM protein [bacterium]